MRESMNIADIEAGLLLQLDGSTSRGYEQSLGRCMRAKDPEFHLVVCKGTKDINYLETALLNFNKNWVIYS